TNTEQVFGSDPNFLPSVISFNQDGTLLAAMDVPNNNATGSVVDIFDAGSAALVSSTPMSANTAITFSPDGTLLAIANRDQVTLLGVDNSEDAQPAVG